MMSIPPRIHLHFGVHATNPKRINDGGNVITVSVLHTGTNPFPKKGKEERGEDWGSVSGTLITILSDTHSHWLPLLLLNRELSWGPWSFIPGKLGPGEGGGWDWCQTSRGTRSTWGFNDISISVVWLRGSKRLRHLKGRQWKKTV